LIKIELGNKTGTVPGEMQRLSYHFLREKSVSCIVELRPNMLLCVSQNDCKYILLDIIQFLERILAQGFSSKAISVCKFP
jgi:hypothetical protein